MSKDIHIIIRDSDNFVFGLMIAGIVIVWFLFVAFAPEKIHHPETEVWLSSQQAMPPVGLDY